MKIDTGILLMRTVVLSSLTTSLRLLLLILRYTFIDGSARTMRALIVSLIAVKKVNLTEHLLKRFHDLKGTRAIVTRPATRANTMSILGAMSASGLITVGVKKPRPGKKRKAD
ncbi:hypothetical protein CLU79DRAFT_752911 [Phycomyces nitens]|nr:hypothetical protein CLU79DRAFT_752911 [Phycomyces nitens]